MVVYADVLIILNIIVDYFLLKLTALITRGGADIKRLLLASVLGGLSSLYIFLPPLSLVFEILIKIFISALMAFAAFGFINIKMFIRRVVTLFAVTFGFAGAMIGVWYAFKPSGMVINNSVVYFNISPVFLIVFSVAGYFISALLRRIFSKSQTEQTCRVKIGLGKNDIELFALVDTGNSLTDPFGDGEIIITDESVARGLLAGEEKDKRYRAIPCVTVSGTVLLEGYRCDRAEITIDKENYALIKPIIAISNTALKGDFKAIINPQSIGL
ncbi:MAG: sigma-E processing peptidase SpoIIGA [Clostridia bacterium]|nr:sigma-E processing peptidase SpoIIGA [Clostridia bacterium]